MSTHSLLSNYWYLYEHYVMLHSALATSNNYTVGHLIDTWQINKIPMKNENLDMNHR